MRSRQRARRWEDDATGKVELRHDEVEVGRGEIKAGYGDVWRRPARSAMDRTKSSRCDPLGGAGSLTEIGFTLELAVATFPPR
uniref:DUF834 domain-containing protein n=1 Tax=Oryza glumipatula TaxID=40148 RepID=A0A0D9ZJM8_9ORYZ